MHMKIEDCALAEDLMPAAAEGALSGESRAFLEEHLKTCTACSALYETLKIPDGQNDAERQESAHQKERWRSVGLPIVLGIGGVAILLIVLFLIMTDGVL